MPFITAIIHPPTPLPRLPTSHPGNRAVTLLLTGSESINTLALRAASQGIQGHGQQQCCPRSTVPPPALAPEDGLGGAVWHGARMCWQPGPKSLGRIWRGASQLSRGQA